MSKASITTTPPSSSDQPLRPPAPLPLSERSLLDTALWLGNGCFKALASLKFTVALFVFSLLLVLFGTLAQIDLGVWTVVHKYFRSFIVWVPFQLPVPRYIHIGGGFPFPGGYTVGGLLLVNLLAPTRCALS
jgi:hypothetical protein